MTGKGKPCSVRAKSPPQARAKSPTKAREKQRPSPCAAPKTLQIPSSGSAKTEAGFDATKKTRSPAPAPAPRRSTSCVSPPRNPKGGVRRKDEKNAGKNVRCHSPDGAKSPIKNCVDTNRILKSTLDKLKIKKDSQCNAASIINCVVDKITEQMKSSDAFCEVKQLRTGSYYENVKILEPDEFDVMFTIPVDRMDIQKFDDEGAFYSVAFKRGSNKHPLNRFSQDGTICASEMLTEFREHVKQAVKGFPEVEVERKKKGCPAVTLQIKTDDLQLGLDIVLSLEVHSSWPAFTQDGFKIESWLGTKVKKDFKLKPFYLVPKYAGNGNEERDGIFAKDAWRISFSHVEKGILKNHGQAKTCCEKNGTKCCRKPCLKLMKHLLHLLKQKHPKELSRFYSYLAKTTLLHACSTRVRDSEWEMAQLNGCFQQILEDFEGHLREGQLFNFFIPTHNLLGSDYSKKSRDFLAKCIENERKNGFPVFRDPHFCTSLWIKASAK